MKSIENAEVADITAYRAVLSGVVGFLAATGALVGQEVIGHTATEIGDGAIILSYGYCVAQWLRVISYDIRENGL